MLKGTLGVMKTQWAASPNTTIQEGAARTVAMGGHHQLIVVEVQWFRFDVEVVGLVLQAEWFAILQFVS